MAPDGGDRGVGEVHVPEPPPVRGPAAGVPDVASFGLVQMLASATAGAGAEAVDPPHARTRFQHTSEARFARLLDFYGIAWEYEPDEFPIAWDDAGEPTRFFRPDFRLPAFDTYIEITTSAQRLVTKKNQKIRALREHHPDVRCKLFYQRDYLALLRDFGLEDGDEEE